MRKRTSMSEVEWIASQDSYEMLKPCRHWIRNEPRKGRLLAVACCRRIWHLLPDERSRAAVETAARFADGQASEMQLQAAEQAAKAAHADAFQKRGKVGSSAEWAAQFSASSDAWFAASRASNFAFVAAGDEIKSGPEHEVQSQLMRCIFGPSPFRPGALAYELWGSPPVSIELAQSIYNQQCWEDLPALGDLLENAGCHATFLLQHCRSEGPHVRGCWAIDVILGKTYERRKRDDDANGQRAR